MSVTTTENIPVLKGAGLSMGFSFGAPDMSKCSIAVENAVGFASTPSASINSSGSGFFNASFAENADLSQMSVDIVLTCGEESDRQTLTFAEGGNFKVETSGEVDYIGGEVSVNVVLNDFTTYTSELRNAGDWIYQTYSGSNNILTVNANDGSERSAEVVFNIKGIGSITYTKSVSVSQKAYGSAIDESRYHQNGSSMQLNQAVSGITPLNIVILGDGYQKKDLQTGGKFERSARSACEAFFGVAPFSDFRDRFNVYMVAYESVDEGPGLNEAHNTYFKTWYKGGNDTYVNYAEGQPISNVLRSTLGFSDDAFYRTVVILLVNTDANIGSTNYLSQTTGDMSVTGDGYATCSVAMVSAGTTGMGGLVRHEGGGHGFGRLGDEYATYSVQTVEEKHTVGFYRNIATSMSYWNAFTQAGYGADKVTYDVQLTDGVYRSTHESGIMWNNNGNFNAVSRHIIYERIIKQTEGHNAYSWENFLKYDKKNL